MTLGVARASRALVLAACLVVLGAACQGTSEQTRLRESLPAFEDVQFIRIDTYPPNPERPLPLPPETNGPRIRWILEHLQSARMSAVAVDRQGLFHASPVLQLYVPDSPERLNIFPAVNCRSPHEGEYQCRYDARDVVVNRGTAHWRLIAPELAAYRGTGWQSETRMVSDDEYRAFMERQFPTLAIPGGPPVRMWVTSLEASSQVALPLVGGTGQDRETIQRVVEWLRAATPGSPETEPDTLFSGPPIPALNTRGGQSGSRCGQAGSVAPAAEA